MFWTGFYNFLETSFLIAEIARNLIIKAQNIVAYIENENRFPESISVMSLGHMQYCLTCNRSVL